ncbi:hypothetical protein RXV86_10225 [Alisedimentitalea sp. MJ-SS2]|nr:hypothetical protein [Alisedimentitalea sp. MJ-SS2]MDU8927760.1 hypothetical protein [Alisedimentitalea sp. MJ-SS2]
MGESLIPLLKAMHGWAAENAGKMTVPAD